MPINPQISAKASERFGLPERFKAYSPFPFAGMNVESSEIAIDDKEFKYVENFLRLGDGNLRTAWGQGPALYTTPDPVNKPIVSFFFYNIGSVFYVAVFLGDGSAVQVQVGSGMVTPIGSGFYTKGGLLPACAQWGVLYLLIANRNTPNDYWVWDGKLLYKAGTAAPNGVNLLSGGSRYNFPPSIAAIGGQGAGMSFISEVNAGAVQDIQITNPGAGYQVGDVVSLFIEGGNSDDNAFMSAFLSSGGVLSAAITAGGTGYTSAPTLGFTGGGGSGAAAGVSIGTGVQAVAVTAGGTGYSFAGVSFSGGGGSGAFALANIIGGIVVSIVVITRGSGYTSNPTVAISGDGTGATATASIQGGIVTGIEITASGSGYTSAPTIGFSGGGGTGAAAVAFLAPSGVAGVTVNAGGTGYTTTPLITFEGGGGAGAAGTVQLQGTSVNNIEVTAGGQNYNSQPTIVFIPDSFGITATANVQNGQLVAINVTDGGNSVTGTVEVVVIPAPGDPGTGAGGKVILNPTSIASVIMNSIGSGYTSPPTVLITPGANNAAYATVNLMPYGVSGGGIETFLGRVWLVDPADPQFGIQPPGGNLVGSAAQLLWQFAPSAGAVTFIQADGFLQTRYTGIRQSNGYLYAFGDGSISVISNIQTTGVPPTTSFTYQNVDPQTGLSWRDSRQDFGRSILFANETGVYGLYGGAVSKVSKKLDQLFTNAVFPPSGGAVTPSSAIATLFNVKHYLCQITIPDPDTGALRNVMVTWNEKEWTLTSQESALVYIGSQKVESKFQAWGTDGASLYPLFERPSLSLRKRFDTKAYGTESMFLLKELWGIWMQAQDVSAGQAGINCSVSFSMSGLADQLASDPSVKSGVYNNVLIAEPSFQSPAPAWGLWAVGNLGLPFISLSARLSTTSPDFTLGNFLMGYTEEAAVF